eukprot:scaffold22582_cov17-Tisochrysis_lutea.AAC.1
MLTSPLVRGGLAILMKPTFSVMTEEYPVRKCRPRACTSTKCVRLPTFKCICTGARGHTCICARSGENAHTHQCFWKTLTSCLTQNGILENAWFMSSSSIAQLANCAAFMAIPVVLRFIVLVESSKYNLRISTG